MRGAGRKCRLSRWLAVWMLLLVASIALLADSWQLFLRCQYPLPYCDMVARESERFALDPMLVYAVMKAESGFDERAGSSAGACGLMQLMPETFEWMQSKLGEEGLYTRADLFDPQVNIHYGCALLRLLLDVYGNEGTALCAYNAGMGTVNGWLKDAQLSSDGQTLYRIPYPETGTYLCRVQKNREMYLRLYGEDGSVPVKIYVSVTAHSAVQG